MKGNTNPQRKILELHQLKTHLGLEQRSEGNYYGFFHLSKKGQTAKKTRNLKCQFKFKKKEKSQISLLGSPTKPTYNQAGTWKQKGGPSQGPIHSKKPQEIELELEILQGKQPTIQKYSQGLYVERIRSSAQT